MSGSGSGTICSLRHLSLGGIFIASLVGCGGAKQEASAPVTLSADDNREDQLAAPPIENVQAPLTHLERKEVDATVAAGVGRFIQGFDMVEELDEYDRFVGWKIGKIHDRDRFEGLGIGPGDVVTSINGLPLERPAQAYEALMSLKTAENLDVEYLRGGRVMRLSLPIVGTSENTAPATEKRAPAAKPQKKAEKPHREGSESAGAEKKKSED